MVCDSDHRVLGNTRTENTGNSKWTIQAHTSDGWLTKTDNYTIDIKLDLVYASSWLIQQVVEVCV